MAGNGYRSASRAIADSGLAGDDQAAETLIADKSEVGGIGKWPMLPLLSSVAPVASAPWQLRTKVAKASWPCVGSPGELRRVGGDAEQRAPRLPPRAIMPWEDTRSADR